MMETNSKISFDFCDKHQGDTMNIFIHGYSSGHREIDKNKLKHYISEINTKDTNVFAFWPSGSFYDNLINFDNIKYLANPLILMTGLVAGQIQNFKKAEENINHIKYEFFILLKRFLKENTGKYKSINIYAHSLGVRLIIESIVCMEDEYGDIGVDNLIFMAGARDLNDSECAKILGVISGSVYNIYSSGDLILKIKPDFEKCIGVHPIDFGANFSDRVHNHPFNLLGHTDYWSNVKNIIKYLDFDKSAGRELITGSTHLVQSFSTKDTLLYNVMYFSTQQERLVIAGLLNKRNKHFSKEDIDQYNLTDEIQLMGGDSILNKIRGHGVKYAEIIRDAADLLEVENYKNFSEVELESIVFDIIMNELNNIRLRNHASHLALEIINDIVSNYHSGRGMLFHDVDYFLEVYNIFDKISFRSIHITGPAYQSLIPIIMVVKLIRDRISKKEQYLSKYISGLDSPTIINE